MLDKKSLYKSDMSLYKSHDNKKYNSIFFKQVKIDQDLNIFLKRNWSKLANDLLVKLIYVIKNCCFVFYIQ